MVTIQNQAKALLDQNNSFLLNVKLRVLREAHKGLLPVE